MDRDFCVKVGTQGEKRWVDRMDEGTGIELCPITFSNICRSYFVNPGSK